MRDKNKKLVANHLTLITVNLQTPKFVRNKLNFGTIIILLVVEKQSWFSLWLDVYGADYYGLKKICQKTRIKIRVQLVLDLTKIIETIELA